MKKNRKWIWTSVLLIMMLCLLAGCGSSGDDVKQTAAAKQAVGEDQVAVMTVDLSGGYSVEFATGAAYFYKGEATDENDPIAYAYVITKEEYDEELAYVKSEKKYKDALTEMEDGLYSVSDEVSCAYYFPTEDGFCMKVVVQESGLEEADSIYVRFTAHGDE